MCQTETKRRMGVLLRSSSAKQSIKCIWQLQQRKSETGCAQTWNGGGGAFTQLWKSIFDGCLLLRPINQLSENKYHYSLTSLTHISQE